jgi:sugar lactone lactonase YvrE
MMAAQSVRVDPQDNIWIVDRYSSMVVKFDPEGRVLMPMGRKPESINVVAPGAAEGRGGRGGRGLPGAGTPGDLFNQPSDVAFDASGDIFVSDGYGNARVAKFDKNGWFIKSWGSKGTETGKFDRASSIATDAQGNVYVAEIGNKRIQVFDNDGNFKSAITNIGAPAAICISPGPHQYLYSSNSNESNTMDNGEIYKLELDGKVLGKFGRAGKLPKEFGTVNEIDCRRANELVVGELANWRVQKLTLHP